MLSRMNERAAASCCFCFCRKDYTITAILLPDAKPCERAAAIWLLAATKQCERAVAVERASPVIAY